MAVRPLILLVVLLAGCGEDPKPKPGEETCWHFHSVNVVDGVRMRRDGESLSFIEAQKFIASVSTAGLESTSLTAMWPSSCKDSK